MINEKIERTSGFCPLINIPIIKDELSSYIDR